MDDFDSIYREYGRMFYLCLLSLSHNESLSEDLTQETMYRAILNIGSFRGDCRLSAWLCQIARNLYFDWQKKNRQRSVNISIDEEFLFPDPDINIEKEVEDRDTANRILQHLHKLEEPYKEVFILHALGSVPLTQISRLFEKSDSWARVTYYRAKAMIIRKLQEES